MSPEDSFFRTTEQGLILFLQVQPNAKKNSIEGITPEGYLKIKVNAPAQKGKANKELVHFFSKTLGLAKSRIEILSGEFSRKKQLLIKTSSPELLENLLSLIKSLH